MKIQLVIAPDFAPEHFAGWHLLNAALQKATGLPWHLSTPSNATEQQALVAQQQADLLYANPFDAAQLIREHGYLALARPAAKPNEIVIAAHADAVAQCVEDLQPGVRIALASNHDVKLVGLRLLEPADLDESSVHWLPAENYQAAARSVIKGEADACFLLAEAYHSLSRLSKSQLKVLVESKLTDISHLLLIHPKVAEHGPAIAQALLALSTSPDGQNTLAELGLNAGFEAMSAEDTEFMIDLMDTLLD